MQKVICFVFVTLFIGCNTLDKKKTYTEWIPPEVDIHLLNFEVFPLKKLSEYGFFKGKLSDLSPKEGIILYQPSSSLFSDYAFKKRFLWIPKNEKANIIENDSEGKIDFPNKTILIKNFYYPHNFQKPESEKTIIETRLFIKYKEKWNAYTYIWNEDQTDAQYKIVGGQKKIDWIDVQGNIQNTTYIIPNQNQCKNCHNEDEALVPIGVKAQYLENILPKQTETQLEHWIRIQYLNHPKNNKNYPIVCNYEDRNIAVEKRARAYLDINCGHCHNPSGSASTSGLFLYYKENNKSRLGIFKTPVAAGPGTGPFTFDIVPKKADKSILLYRMNSKEIGIAMPEIGRTVIHTEGVALIKEWIDNMMIDNNPKE